MSTWVAISGWAMFMMIAPLAVPEALAALGALPL